MKLLGGITLAIAAAALVFHLQRETDPDRKVPVLPPRVVELPGSLREISGLAVTPDGRVFGHNDEKGIVAQLDLRSGNITKSFSLGRPAERADFEDIAFVGDRFFLVTSSGVLYEFSEGTDGEAVTYIRRETFLGRNNNIEGLCHDPRANVLLLACKDFPGEGYHGMKAVYSWPLGARVLLDRPRYLIPETIAGRKQKLFAPSAIAFHEPDNRFFLLSSRSKTLVVLEYDGRISFLRKLPEGAHHQPEGMAFLPDGSLLISDEGGSNRKATITVYPAGAWENWK